MCGLGSVMVVACSDCSRPVTSLAVFPIGPSWWFEPVGPVRKYGLDPAIMADLIGSRWLVICDFNCASFAKSSMVGGYCSVVRYLAKIADFALTVTAARPTIYLDSEFLVIV